MTEITRLVPEFSFSRVLNWDAFCYCWGEYQLQNFRMLYFVCDGFCMLY